MAIFTPVDAEELARFIHHVLGEKVVSYRGIEAGSVNSNFAVELPGRALFLRLYEEQEFSGAEREAKLVATLAARGVPTPAPLAAPDGALVRVLSSKPAALFPWRAGTSTCQAAVSPVRAQSVGRALAQVHRAGLDLTLWPSRFGEPELESRLARIGADRTYGAEAPGLRAALAQIGALRDRSLPRGLVHGDLFRDNVLWEGDRITALLDFESASEGVLAYDLAVTMLAFGYGDGLELPLLKAMVAGYEGERPLGPKERAGLFAEARAAALRFTITRITDYAMRNAGAGPRVLKDWRRFQARQDALVALGPEGFHAALFGG
ncbi:MAG TPA: homoserine kinase [Polyangiaceae bacterium]